MRRLALLALFLVGCEERLTIVTPALPEDVTWLGVLFYDADGALVNATGLGSRREATRLLSEVPPSAQHLALYGFTDAQIPGDVSEVRRLPLRPAGPKDPALPAPRWFGRGAIDGHRATVTAATDPPLVTAPWVRACDTVLDPDEPVRISGVCGGTPCTAVAQVRDCRLQIDARACGEIVHEVDLAKRESAGSCEVSTRDASKLEVRCASGQACNFTAFPKPEPWLDVRRTSIVPPADGPVLLTHQRLTPPVRAHGLIWVAHWRSLAVPRGRCDDPVESVLQPLTPSLDPLEPQAAPFCTTEIAPHPDGLILMSGHPMNGAFPIEVVPTETSTGALHLADEFVHHATTTEDRFAALLSTDFDARLFVWERRRLELAGTMDVGDGEQLIGLPDGRIMIVGTLEKRFGLVDDRLNLSWIPVADDRCDSASLKPRDALFHEETGRIVFVDDGITPSVVAVDPLDGDYCARDAFFEWDAVPKTVAPWSSTEILVFVADRTTDALFVTRFSLTEGRMLPGAVPLEVTGTLRRPVAGPDGAVYVTHSRSGDLLRLTPMGAETSMNRTAGVELAADLGPSGVMEVKLRLEEGPLSMALRGRGESPLVELYDESGALLETAGAEAILETTLSPGHYRARLTGTSSAAIVLELREGSGRIVELSMEADAALTGILKLAPGGRTALVARALGPSLGPEGLPDPVLRISSGGLTVRENDDWQPETPREVRPPHPREAAARIDLDGGTVTFRVEDAARASGRARLDLLETFPD